MSTIAFVFLVLVVGLTTGRLIGAALAFTRSRTRDDLIAGLSGAIVGAVPVHFIGPAEYREPLPALLIGVSAAILATWLRRIVAWRQEPLRRVADDAAESSQPRHRHDRLTTPESPTLLPRAGRLTVEEAEVVHAASRASA